MLSESSCNEHQTLRYLAKSIHGVNEGSATEVDRYQMSEMGLSIALEMVRSPKLARLPYRTAEEPWLPDGWACRWPRAGSGHAKWPGIISWTCCAFGGTEKIPRCPIPEISLSVQTKLHERCQVQFWELWDVWSTERHMEMWLWCQRPLKFRLKWLFNCDKSEKNASLQSGAPQFQGAYSVLGTTCVSVSKTKFPRSFILNLSL